MSQHREHHLELCAAHVFSVLDPSGNSRSALDPADARDLEAHLAEGCEVCEAELRQLAGATSLMAAAAPPATPSPQLKGRVLEALGSRAPVVGGPEAFARAAPRRRPSMAWGWAAVAAGLAFASVLMWRTGGQLRNELADMRRQLDATRLELDEKQRELADARLWADLIEGEGSRVVDLQLTPQGGALMRGRAIYDPRARRAIVVFANATPPGGSDYELWALRGGPPVSLGLIRADATGRAVVKLPDLGDPSDLAAFAVSLEKAGGSTSAAGPEGPVVMVGKLGGL